MYLLYSYFKKVYLSVEVNCDNPAIIEPDIITYPPIATNNGDGDETNAPPITPNANPTFCILFQNSGVGSLNLFNISIFSSIYFISYNTSKFIFFLLYKVF